MLHHQLLRLNLPKPSYLSQWIDAKLLIRSAFYKQFRRGTLLDCMTTFGLEFPGRQHSGIDDSIALYELVRAAKLQGLRLNITGSFDPSLHQLIKSTYHTRKQKRERKKKRQDQQQQSKTQLLEKFFNIKVQREPATRRTWRNINKNEQRSSSGNIDAAPPVNGPSVPRCYCNDRCRLQVVRRVGPNQGRQIWSCGNYDYITNTRRCNFFHFAEERTSIHPTLQQRAAEARQ